MATPSYQSTIIDRSDLQVLSVKYLYDIANDVLHLTEYHVLSQQYMGRDEEKQPNL